MTDYKSAVERFVWETLKKCPKAVKYFSDAQGNLKLGYQITTQDRELPFIRWSKPTDAPVKFAISQMPYQREAEVSIDFFTRDVRGEGRADKLSILEVIKEVRDKFTLPSGDRGLQILFCDVVENEGDPEKTKDGIIYHFYLELDFNYTDFNSTTN
jgi:hypothetical protein